MSMLLLSASVILTVAPKVALPKPQPFQCGNLTLTQVDQVSATKVAQGTAYAVIVRITNVGTTEGLIATNFLFIDPNGAIVDGSSGPNIYYLKPGQSVVLPWHHTFGCANRPKGEYELGIGTQVWSTGAPTACNYTYHEVELLNDTICAGFTP